MRSVGCVRVLGSRFACRDAARRWGEGGAAARTYDDSSMWMAQLERALREGARGSEADSPRDDERAELANGQLAADGPRQ